MDAIPRALNEPVGLRPSSFTQRSLAPIRAARRSAFMMGVRPSPRVTMCLGSFDRQERRIAPHVRRRFRERLAVPGCFRFREIVADQQRAAAFAQRLHLSGFVAPAANATLQMRDVGHNRSSMIARKVVVGCLLFVVGLYALCGAGIFLLRWIDPWTTMVQMERRVAGDCARIVRTRSATSSCRFQAFHRTCSTPLSRPKTAGSGSIMGSIGWRCKRCWRTI